MTDPKIFGREGELKFLDDAWTENDQTNVIALVAGGGVGKTALVNHWLHQTGGWRGAERVLGWSFYSQGAEEGRQATGNDFLRWALEKLGDPAMAESAQSGQEKGERLAELIRDRRTLLLLDGLEPLQEPPGPAAARPGKLKDPGVRQLLRALANKNPGLCVVSTRLGITDLRQYEGKAFKSRDLDDLTEQAGAAYLRSLGMSGTEKELRKASREFTGHAMGLSLLGSYLTAVHGGPGADIRTRDRIPHLIDPEVEKGEHAGHVMGAYVPWLRGKPELDVLHMVGLFDRPAESGAIDAVRANPPIKGLTERIAGVDVTKWKFILKRLRDMRLLAKSGRQSETLDTHPLVREYFGRRLQETNPEAFREGHNRLFEYYRNLPEKDLPDTLEEMRPLFRAVLHGARAGRHQEALDEVYYRRIRRGAEEYSSTKLGAFGEQLSALAGLFDPPWRQPVKGSGEHARAFLLNEAAMSLRALGRLREAVESTAACLDISIAKKSLVNAAISANNLSEIQLTLGEIKRAVDYGEESVRYADESRDMFERFSNRTTHADALFQAGSAEPAEAFFKEAEKMQQEFQPEFPILYGLMGFQFCDLVLAQGGASEARRRSAETVALAKERNLLLSIALDHLTLGRVALLGRAALETEPAKSDGSFAEADRELTESIEGLRKAGMQDHLPRGLLARAELFRAQRDFDQARRDLDEAYEMATLGEMRLHECDVHIECSRMLLAMIEAGESLEAGSISPVSPFARFGAATEPLAAARRHRDKADAMVQKMGYHRRDPELLLEHAHVMIHEGKLDEAREKLTEAGAKIDEMGLHIHDRVARDLEALLEQKSREG